MVHTQHDFELDKQCQAYLEAALYVCDSAMKGFPRGPMGLTPDDVKASDTWKAAKKSYDKAFNSLREFNGLFVKKYKKELAQERKARIAALNRKFQEGNHEQA